MTLQGTDVLRLFDLSTEEIKAVLDRASRQKAAIAAGASHPASAPLRGKAVAIILEKPSVRTRVSFERGCVQLGAQPIIMSGTDTAFSRGESIKDTVGVIERYCDAIVLRTFEQSKIEEVAHWAHVPVINALTDEFHPCQGLADLLTIQEHKGTLAGITLAYVGDGNNMAATYLEAGALTGMNVRIATPLGYEPAERIVAESQEKAQATGASILIMTDPQLAVAGADVVVTDTWASMGAEAEHAERVEAFAAYQVNDELMAQAAPDAIFMHCLPAHRGEEVTDAVADSSASVIYDEAENRLHAQKALLTLLLAGEEEA